MLRDQSTERFVFVRVYASSEPLRRLVIAVGSLVFGLTALFGSAPASAQCSQSGST